MYWKKPLQNSCDNLEDGLLTNELEFKGKKLEDNAGKTLVAMVVFVKLYETEMGSEMQCTNRNKNE